MHFSWCLIKKNRRHMWVGFFKFTAWWKPLAVVYILRSVVLPLISDFFLYKAGYLSGVK